MSQPLRKIPANERRFVGRDFSFGMPPRAAWVQRTILSSSEIQSLTWASDGMRQSPRGEKLTRLIFGPSGMQERLNCWLKKRQ